MDNDVLPSTVRDPSLTLTQFCELLKTLLFYRAYETLPQHLRDSLGCKDCCANTNVLTYLLIHLWVVHTVDVDETKLSCLLRVAV